MFGQDSVKEEEGHNKNRSKNNYNNSNISHKNGNGEGGGHGGIRSYSDKKQGYDPFSSQFHEVTVDRKKQRSRKSRKKFGSAVAQVEPEEDEELTTGLGYSGDADGSGGYYNNKTERPSRVNNNNDNDNDSNKFKGSKYLRPIAFSKPRKLPHIYNPNKIGEPDSPSVVVFEEEDDNREQEVIEHKEQQSINKNNYHHGQDHSNTLLEILIGNGLQNTGTKPVSAATVLKNNLGGTSSSHQNSEHNLKSFKMESEFFSSYREYQINDDKNDTPLVVNNSLQQIDTIPMTNLFAPVNTEIDSATFYTNEEPGVTGARRIDDSYIYENEETGEIIVYKPKPLQFPRKNEIQPSSLFNLPNTGDATAPRTLNVV
ncbi:14077_t:CDS:2 [Ambispora leptoticha]|uniref:14077_t:CDS:1 n=1 Tax=Ambispora leptoticha TaxID=144679 RepID=A0A9N8ZVR4_9GLOM|nr:14077_t:CDS:2 [Ambispora leptoticha]